MRKIFQFSFLQESEKAKIVEKLIEESRMDKGYFLMLVISSSIITIGLVVGQISIVIGGMLIAPLLFPVLSLGLALSTVSLKGCKRAIIGIFISTAVVIATSYLVSNLLEGAEFRGYEIIIGLRPSFLSFLIATLSGIAAAYSWLKKNVSVILPGVAIAVTLVPPLCATGIALAVHNSYFLKNFFELYFLNLLGVVLASMLVFFFTGFTKVKKAEKAALEKEEKVE